MLPRLSPWRLQLNPVERDLSPSQFWPSPQSPQVEESQVEETQYLYERLAFYHWIDYDQGTIIHAKPQRGITQQHMNDEVSGFMQANLPLVPSFYINFIDEYFDGDIPDAIIARLSNFPNQLCCSALLNHISSQPDSPLVTASVNPIAHSSQ